MPVGEKLADDLIVGAKAIAVELGMTERQVFYAAEIHQLPIFKLGKKLAVRRTTLRQCIVKLEEAAA